MEYNTTRSQMKMPEYGRNVQKMVEFLTTIEDKEKRLRNAEFIIELMGTLNPHLKQIEDYRHKLWDHLYQMTGFNLEVDSPYPMPTPESVFKKPPMLDYPQKHITHRHLGQNVDDLISKALEETDPEKKQGLTQAIGYYMKLAYANWHKEPVHDDMIKNELLELTDGQLLYEPGGFRPQFDSRSNFRSKNPNFNANSNNPNNKNYRGGGSGGNGRGFKDNGGGGNGNYKKNFNKNKYNKNK